MELVIIGGGAIGGTIAAHMTRSGHNVTICDADLDHVAAIRSKGLIIEGPVENFTVQLPAILPDELPERMTHAAVAVKSHDTQAAADMIRGRIAPGGYVVSFQNGLTADILTDAVGADNLLVSFVNFGADVIAPGRIMQGNVATFRVGEPYRREVTDRVRDLVDALPYAEATGNIMGYLWGKEAYGAMLYAGAVSDLSIADSLESPRYRELMLAIAKEVLNQAPVQPEGFDGFEPRDLEGSLARLASFNRQSAKTHSGIYRDLMVRKRKTEVDDLIRDLKGPLTTYAAEIIRAIERGERTCEVANLELLAALERLESRGRPLQAVVDVVPAPRRAPKGPLHGVPIAVKDLVAVKGLTRGCGNPYEKTESPRGHDAPVVEALRDAGADIFCTTALLEFAAGALHPDIPETRNPRDISRTAGGSSGGSAALVGAGVCDVAIGTDTGGSIRIPAHYCDVVGFKPSYGALSLEGVQALAPSLDHVGLLSSNVEIAARVFHILTSSDVVVPPSRLLTLGVGTLMWSDPAIHADVRLALEEFRSLMDGQVRFVDVDDRELVESRRLFEPLVMFEMWRELGERATQYPERFGPETLRLVLSSASVSEMDYLRAKEELAELRSKPLAVYDGVDALLTPAVPYVAPTTTPPMDTLEGEHEGLFSAPFNITGDPAVVIPVGATTAGLPVGIQLAASRGRDGDLLAVATRVSAMLSAAELH